MCLVTNEVELFCAVTVIVNCLPCHLSNFFISARIVLCLVSLFFFFFLETVVFCYPGWSAVA